jgi:hypothetical protein
MDTLNEIARAGGRLQKQFKGILGERSFESAPSAAEQPAGKGRRMVVG